MNDKRPTPVIRRRDAKDCPVCGKPSYSRDGIHPQCAIVQADSPRQQQLAAEKKQKAAPKKKSKQNSWTKKCPKCNALVHVRLKVCSCGYNFDVLGKST